MPVLEQLAMDQFDPWQVVTRQVHVFTSYSLLLISTGFVVVSHVGCLVVSGVVIFINLVLQVSVDGRIAVHQI